jgi:hypothetical protein
MCKTRHRKVELVVEYKKKDCEVHHGEYGDFRMWMSELVKKAERAAVEV